MEKRQFLKTQNIKLEVTMLLPKMMLFLLLICESFSRVGTTLAECGRRSECFIRHSIRGGTSAPRSQWPWLVSLRFTSDGSHFCGGAFIDDSVIVTAAHCLTDRSTGNPRPENSVQVSVPGNGINNSEIYQVHQFIVHVNYDPNGPFTTRYAYDVALIKLSTNPALVNPICLPNASAPDPTDCIVAGWGDTKDGATSYSEDLRYVSVPMLSGSICHNTWKEYLDETMFCAGVPSGTADERRGACAGDSGGPLMCRLGNKWYAYGVVSFGSEICLRAPNVYASLRYLRQWVMISWEEITDKTVKWVPVDSSGLCANTCNGTQPLSMNPVSSQKGHSEWNFYICSTNRGLHDQEYRSGFIHAFELDCRVPYNDSGTHTEAPNFNCLCAVDPHNTNRMRWVDSTATQSCSQACTVASGSWGPVVAGVKKIKHNNGQVSASPFYVCSASVNTLDRPGYQFSTTSNDCSVAFGRTVKHEKSGKKCLCHSDSTETHGPVTPGRSFGTEIKWVQVDSSGLCSSTCSGTFPNPMHPVSSQKGHTEWDFYICATNPGLGDQGYRSGFIHPKHDCRVAYNDSGTHTEAPNFHCLCAVDPHNGDMIRWVDSTGSESCSHACTTASGGWGPVVAGARKIKHDNGQISENPFYVCTASVNTLDRPGYQFPAIDNDCYMTFGRIVKHGKYGKKCLCYNDGS